MSNISKSNNKTTVIAQPRGSVKKGKADSITNRYHNSEIDVYEYLVKQAIKMTWAGILLMGAGLIYSFLGEYDINKLLTVFPGGFVSLMSGTMIYLVHKSSENKQKYFDSLIKMEHERAIIEMIQKEESPEFRQESIHTFLEK